jgi:hypothetical protein
MLRIGYLPSDYHPMVLMLGEAEDFRALAGVLRHFARAPVDTRLDTLGFCRPYRTRLTLTASDGPPGIQPSGGEAFVWRLDESRAGAFAAQAETLTDPGPWAGSEMLECSIGEEIPVKLSRGEYTDDFLSAPAA